MKSQSPHLIRALAATCGALLLLQATGAAGATDATDRADLEKRLQDARSDLDRSAREVAELSRELYGDPSGHAMQLVLGGRGSMLGINIGGGSTRDEGVEVAGVSPGGPAAQAGLESGDVLLSVDGQGLKRSGERGPNVQLVEFMRGVEPGRAVKLEYLRDGKRRTATVTTAPAEPPIVRVIRERMAGPLGDSRELAMPHLESLLGPGRAFGELELVPVTPKLGAYFGTDRGLLVVRAPGGKGLPLEEGDVLQSIDGRTPENAGHAFRILRSYQPGEKVKLGVLRQRKPLTLDATMPAADAASRAMPHLHRVPPPAPVPAPARPAPTPPPVATPAPASTASARA